MYIEERKGAELLSIFGKMRACFSEIEHCGYIGMSKHGVVTYLDIPKEQLDSRYMESVMDRERGIVGKSIHSYDYGRARRAKELLTTSFRHHDELSSRLLREGGKAEDVLKFFNMSERLLKAVGHPLDYLDGEEAAIRETMDELYRLDRHLQLLEKKANEQAKVRKVKAADVAVCGRVIESDDATGE